jgi:hypothetical protein
MFVLYAVLGLAGGLLYMINCAKMTSEYVLKAAQPKNTDSAIMTSKTTVGVLGHEALKKSSSILRERAPPALNNSVSR